MPIPGTPHDAADIERIALKNMDLHTAADRQAEFEQAEHVYEIAAQRRNAAVLALLDRGAQQQEVADALGITRGRVAQIRSAAIRDARRAQAEQKEEVAA